LQRGAGLPRILAEPAFGHRGQLAGLPRILAEPALIIAVASLLQAAVGGFLIRKKIGYPVAFDNVKESGRNGFAYYS
jgi:hypothetical protein